MWLFLYFSSISYNLFSLLFLSMVLSFLLCCSYLYFRFNVASVYTFKPIKLFPSSFPYFFITTLRSLLARNQSYIYLKKINNAIKEYHLTKLYYFRFKDYSQIRLTHIHLGRQPRAQFYF